MTAKVYENGQYFSKNWLLEAVFKASSEIDKNEIQKLYKSFPDRLIRIIQAKR